MKRYIFALILLFLTACSVFFIGYLTLRLKAGTYAVLITKTGGVSPTVLKSGTFVWKIESLLPTNVRLIKFTHIDGEKYISAAGELPSARIYSEFMAGKPDFSYSLKAKIKAAVKAESLAEIFTKFGTDNDQSLQTWLNSELDLLGDELKSILINSTDDDSIQSEQSLIKTLSLQHPYIEILAVSIQELKRPDPKLYAAAQNFYTTYMENYKSIIEPMLTSASAESIKAKIRIEALRAYGELLNQYPILIDYLAIEAGIPPRQIPMTTP